MIQFNFEKTEGLTFRLHASVTCFFRQFLDFLRPEERIGIQHELVQHAELVL